MSDDIKQFGLMVKLGKHDVFNLAVKLCDSSCFQKKIGRFLK